MKYAIRFVYTGPSELVGKSNPTIKHDQGCQVGFLFDCKHTITCDDLNAAYQTRASAAVCFNDLYQWSVVEYTQGD